MKPETFDFLLLLLNSFFSVFFGQAVRVFAKSPGDWGSIPGRVIPKTQKNST